MVERSAVNRIVVGSSPTTGVDYFPYGLIVLEGGLAALGFKGL